MVGFCVAGHSSSAGQGIHAMFWLARQTLRGIERLNEFVDEAPDA